MTTKRIYEVFWNGHDADPDNSYLFSGTGAMYPTEVVCEVLMLDGMDFGQAADEADAARREGRIVIVNDDGSIDHYRDRG